MKTASAILISIGLFCLAVFAQVGTISRQVLVDTNGVIVFPPNLWVANSNEIVAVTGTGGGGGGSGTVTSVGASSSVSGLGFSGSPVTTSGTLSLTGTVALASGGTGATNASGARTALSLVPGTDVQAYDTDLAAIAALANSGIVVRTGAGTVSARTITGDSEISVTNGDGVIGNPTLAIGAAIARLASPALTGSPTVPDDAYDATGWNGSTGIPTKNAIRDKIESMSSGGGTSIATNWFVKPTVAGSLTTLVPQPVAATTNSTWAPDFSSGRVHRVTMNGNLTLSAPSNVASEMIGQTFLLILEQDSTGGRSVTTATNYLFGQEITSIGVSTNAGSRSYVTVCVLRTNVLDVLGNLTGFTQ